MPSWQARIASFYLRNFIKRRPLNNETANVQYLRDKLTTPPFLRKLLASGTTNIRQVEESGTRGEWVINTSQPLNVVYYLHGGGYIACSPATHRPFTAALSHAAQAKVFALDYRLAPEHRFPAAVEDALAGYRWLLQQGVEPQSIVIGGDSAGGGLTMATLVALRDEKLPLPRAAFCLSPWTDLAVTGNSLTTNDDDDPMFFGDSIRQAAPIYLGQTAANHSLASPLYADLTGLPPLLLYVSDTEVLLDDSVRLAERARAHGVSVDLRVWEDLPHVWPIFIGLRLPEAREALIEIAQFIRFSAQAQPTQAARASA